MMNGILVVDKPQDFTSFDVVAKLRGICETKKIGHGGTLDPMATGVLPVFIGPAVKAVDLAPNQDKAYEAEVQFGMATDTGDVTGEVLQRSDTVVEGEALRALLPRFMGPQQQLPPMYSAVKVKGRPLYKYAREGKEVPRKPRPVEITELELLGTKGENRFALSVACSKGTYIRTLVEDMGRALEVPATLAALRRTRAGAFGLERAHTLPAIQAAKDTGRLAELLLPVEELFCDVAPLQVDEKALVRLLNGAPVYRVAAPAGRCRIRAGDEFAGLGLVDEEGTLRAQKLFWKREDG